MNWYLWLALAIVFFIAEAMTINMVTIWFAGGAIIAMIMSLYSLTVEWQILTFIAFSTAFLLIFIFLVKPRMNQKQKKLEPTNADRLLGCEGLVTVDINNLEGGGRVNVKGQDWSALSVNDTFIPQGQKIIVKDIQGVKMIVQSL